jgi:hypothetical protein
MSLPYPGLATSKLASKPQSSLAKRASQLCATTLSTKACESGGEGTVATVKASNEPNSNESSTEESSHNPLSFGVICNTKAKIASKPSLSEATDRQAAAPDRDSHEENNNHGDALPQPQTTSVVESSGEEACAGASSRPLEVHAFGGSKEYQHVPTTT